MGAFLHHLPEPRLFELVYCFEPPRRDRPPSFWRPLLPLSDIVCDPAVRGGARPLLDLSRRRQPDRHPLGKWCVRAIRTLARACPPLCLMLMPCAARRFVAFPLLISCSRAARRLSKRRCRRRSPHRCRQPQSRPPKPSAKADRQSRRQSRAAAAAAAATAPASAAAAAASVCDQEWPRVRRTHAVLR